MKRLAAKAILVSGLVFGGVFWGHTGYAAGVGVADATPEQAKSAENQFFEAMSHYKKERFDAALEGFRASYEIVASPNSRLMIARSLRELRRTAEAYTEFELTEKESRELSATKKKYQETEKAARKEADELRPKIALLTVRVIGGDATVKVGDQALGSAEVGTPMPMMPGDVQVVASGPGKPDVREAVSLEAGGESTVTLDLAKAWAEKDETPPPTHEVEGSTSGLTMRHWSYIAGGVGAAGLITFGIFGAMNNSKFSDLEGSCPANQCPPEVEDDINTGKQYQTIANVGLIVGAVGIGAGVTLFLLSGDDEPADAQASRTPRVYLGPGSVAVRGQF